MNIWRKIVTICLLHIFIPFSIVLSFPIQTVQKTLALTSFYNTSENSGSNEIGEVIYKGLQESLGNDSRLAVQEAVIEDPAYATFEAVVGAGQSVNADAILVGGFSKIGGMIRIDSRLIDLNSEEVLLSETKYLMEGENMDEVIEELAEICREEMVGPLPVASNKPVEPTATNVSANTPVEEIAGSSDAIKSAAAGGSGVSWLIYAAAGVGVAGGAYLLYQALNTNTSTVSINIPLP